MSPIVREKRQKLYLKFASELFLSLLLASRFIMVHRKLICARIWPSRSGEALGQGGNGLVTRSGFEQPKQMMATILL